MALIHNHGGNPSNRVLLCSTGPPWGESHGYQLRLAMTAEGLARVGQVDVCVLSPGRTPDLDRPPPSHINLAEWYRVESSPRWMLDAALGRVSPVRNHWLSADALAAARNRFFSGRYDLIWCADAGGYEPIAGLVGHPVVLDLQNINTSLIRSKRMALWHRRPSVSAVWELARAPAAVPLLERRWHEWYERAAAAVDRVSVCSALDADRLEVDAEVAVIPNCYPAPQRAAGRDPIAGPGPRIGFVGMFRYQPNVDGLRWFVDHVLGRVHARKPSAELRAIGTGSSRLSALHLTGRQGVRMLGYVPDLSQALREIDILIAPLHVGGGTRLKVLEGFAHRIPVVSTTVGAEGIGARHLEHLLIADDAPAFARAICRLSDDLALRSRLVDAAARFYTERFTWSRGVAAAAALADDVMGGCGGS